MLLVIDKRDFKLWIGLKGLEPIWKTYYKHERGSSTYERELFFPLRHFKRTVLTILLWQWLVYVKKQKPVMCQMCGSSIATTTMPDPDYRSDKTLIVCERCPRYVIDCMIESARAIEDSKFGLTV